MEVKPIDLHRSGEVDVTNNASYSPDNSKSQSDVVESVNVQESENSPMTEPNNSSQHIEDEELDEYEPEVSLKYEQGKSPKHESEDDYEPDYEPELGTKSKLESPESTESILKNLPDKPTLPQKPNIQTDTSGPSDLKDAFEAIKETEIINDPNFHNLSPEEQVAKIQDQLSKRGINISHKTMNYDQVYSFNKPFKNLKDPIPLVPINEFCKRPNITAPMTPEEEQEYEAFIETENHYMNLQNWDEFPDQSRLFIGNLPANTVSKQDLFRIFSKYGEIIQIAIKAGYGFIQFRTAEACLACIKGETGVPLHNKYLRLDASKPQKSRRPGNPEINNPNLSARGREREHSDEPIHKKKKGSTDCIVYVTGKSSVFFIRKVKKAFANSKITIDTEDVTQKNIADVLSEAAYSGVLGACVVKEQKIDLQTYENTPDGGIKFDEYADIEPEQGAEIMSKAKSKRYGNSPPPYQSQDISYHDNSGPNHRGRSHQRGGRGGRNRRGDHGHGRNRMHDYKQQPQPYGSFPQQPFAQVQQPPYNSFQQPSYGSPPQQPTFNAYGNAQFSQPQSNNNNLMQALQGLNPSQVQSLITALQTQNQPQQQQQPQPAPQPYFNYNQPQATPYGQVPPPIPNLAQTPSNQVNALLAQLQQTSPTTFSQPGNNQQSSTTEAFLDTLKRLSNK